MTDQWPTTMSEGSQGIWMVTCPRSSERDVGDRHGCCKESWTQHKEDWMVVFLLYKWLQQLSGLARLVRLWSQGCGFNPRVGHSFKSRAWWSLWVPSHSKYPVICDQPPILGEWINWLCYLCKSTNSTIWADKSLFCPLVNKRSRNSHATFNKVPNTEREQHRV